MGQASQLGQQGSDHGKYGQTPMASPYGMDGVADANAQQNENTQSANDYSAVLPANTLTQGPAKQWYPGIYPNTQPQFGTNPYSPQTANIQGHPGHNPSTLANVEPNMHNNAFSGQGQFVQRMARGGQPAPAPAPVNFSTPFTTPSTKWVNASTANTQYFPVTDPLKSTTPVSSPLWGSKGASSAGGLPTGNIDAFNSAFNKGAPANPNGLSKGPAQTSTPTPTPAPVVAPKEKQVYSPSYTQYAPIRNPNIDSYGNPLFNNGGLASIPRK